MIILDLQLDKKSKAPLYQQIKEQIIDLIHKGVLKEGYRLPSSRDLSQLLNIDRSTVYKAYRELWSLGFVDSQPGSYTTIRNRPPLQQRDSAHVPPQWMENLVTMEDSYFSHFLTRGLTYDFRNFSPDPSIIPSEDFRRCYNDVMKEKGEKLLGYGNPGGYDPLLQYISQLMSSQYIKARHEELMICEGAQSALDLLCRLFRKEKWSVVTEEPGYSEAIRLFESHGAGVLPCPIYDDGPDLNRLESLFQKESPAFFFTIPNFQNPTGYSSSQKNREELLSLCEKYQIPLIEDGYSQDMRGTLLSIKSMDRRDMVIYLGTFSKILFPGVRTGWIYGNEKLIESLKNLQYISKVSGNMAIQAALERFCRLGYYDIHLKRIYKFYERRMKSALSAFERYLPLHVGTYTEPSGGYYLWLTLKKGLSDEKYINEELMKQAIALRPGSLSLINPSPTACFRFSTAHRSEEEIIAGIKTMCGIFKRIQKEKNHG